MAVAMNSVQITDLARPLVAMAQTIVDYYKDPAHEDAFRKWYRERYGHDVPEGV